jgi:hypothetical protein
MEDHPEHGEKLPPPDADFKAFPQLALPGSALLTEWRAVSPPSILNPSLMKSRFSLFPAVKFWIFTAAVRKLPLTHLPAPLRWLARSG